MIRFPIVAGMILLLIAQPTSALAQALDVTAAVSALVQDNTLHVTADKALTEGQDPAHKQVKKLIVIATVAGAEQMAIAREGEALDIAAPADETLTVKRALFGSLPDKPDASALLAASFPLAPFMTPPGIVQARPALQVTPIKPQLFEQRGNIYFCDFGADWFANLEITLSAPVQAGTLTVRLGEKLDGKAIDRKPPGSVSTIEVPVTLVPGQTVYRLDIPLKKGAQTKEKSIRLPAEIGNISPFRYAEIEGSHATLTESSVRQLSVHTAFDDNASAFKSSDETLNAVWDLCKHTMKAVTAFGVYVDGERERLPYEADAYINFLSHLATDSNPEMGRYSMEFLLANPTWPTEWSFHMPMMAAAEYEATGDPTLAARNYDVLRRKLLMDKARKEDGLLRAKAIVDWPPAERDGFGDGQMPQVNTAVNAFYYHALKEMTLLATGTGKDADAREFTEKSKQIYESFNRVFFDASRGIYIDGEGSSHASLHANMFPLAFGLVPDERKAKVADFVVSRGMACSVYGAQYLLEALFDADRAKAAIALMTARTDRSWWHMIDLGSTMTLEAWDVKFKKNLTWNHAWGAAPANIIMRYVLGVRPAEPGYKKILIAPQPGGLKWMEGKVPTAIGPVSLRMDDGATFKLQVELPSAAKATVVLPRRGGGHIFADGKPASALANGDMLVVEGIGPGRHVFEVR